MSEQKRKDVYVQIPVSSHEGGVVDVRAYFPERMTEAEWEQFHRVLDAMKPTLVEPPAGGDTNTTNHEDGRQSNG